MGGSQGGGDAGAAAALIALRMICDTAQQCAHDGRAPAEYLLELRDVSLQFRGIKALALQKAVAEEQQPT